MAEHKPLHGQSVLSPKISTQTGNRVLALRWHAAEMGAFERVSTSIDSQYPGINQIELHDARWAYDGPPALHQAMAYSKLPPMKFLISKVDRIAVITSQIGYGEDAAHSGTIDVPPANSFDAEKSPVESVDLVAYPTEMAALVIKWKHIGRVSLLGGDVMEELAQDEADDIFRFMFSGSQEAS